MAETPLPYFPIMRFPCEKYGLRKDGLGLLIYDAYRPWSVTKLFWQVVTEDQRPYVADPAEGSRHNRGSAVDLSLFDIDSGRPLEMPSGFDDFDERSHPNFGGGTRGQRKNRDQLRDAMESGGFIVNPKEWWHFDHKDWDQYEILDTPFSEL